MSRNRSRPTRPHHSHAPACERSATLCRLNRRGFVQETVMGTIGDVNSYIAGLATGANRTFAECRGKDQSASHARGYPPNRRTRYQTPMNAILGFTELLAEQITDPRKKPGLRPLNPEGKACSP